MKFQRFLEVFQRPSQRPSQSADFLSELQVLLPLIMLPLKTPPNAHVRNRERGHRVQLLQTYLSCPKKALEETTCPKGQFWLPWKQLSFPEFIGMTHRMRATCLKHTLLQHVACSAWYLRTPLAEKHPTPNDIRSHHCQLKLMVAIHFN